MYDVFAFNQLDLLFANMSGLPGQYYGKINDIVKRHGSIMAAQKEPLRLLSVLPFDTKSK